MSGNLVVLGYVAVITLGLRWRTLPEDIAYTQQVLTVGTQFCLSVLKHLCKKRLSNFTDNSLVYPRPPRTNFVFSDPPPACPEGSGSDSEPEQSDNDEKESEATEDDADAHGDDISQGDLQEKEE